MIYVIDNPEDAIRYSGLIFECIGIYVVYQHIKTSSGESLLQSFVDWLKRLPLVITGQTINIETGIESREIKGHAATLRFWRNVAADDSLEDKISAQIENLEALKNEYDEHRRLYKKFSQNITRDFANNQTKLESAIHELRVTVKRQQREKAGVERFGLAWVVFGLTFATIPGEIVRGLRYLFGA